MLPVYIYTVYTVASSFHYTDDRRMHYVRKVKRCVLQVLSNKQYLLSLDKGKEHM